MNGVSPLSPVYNGLSNLMLTLCFTFVALWMVIVLLEIGRRLPSARHSGPLGRLYNSVIPRVRGATSTHVHRRYRTSNSSTHSSAVYVLFPCSCAFATEQKASVVSKMSRDANIVEVFRTTPSLDEATAASASSTGRHDRLDGAVSSGTRTTDSDGGTPFSIHNPLRAVVHPSLAPRGASLAATAASRGTAAASVDSE